MGPDDETLNTVKETIMLKRIHHVGIVVRSIADAYTFYRDTLSLPVHKEDIIQDQGVKAALLIIGASELELLEPITAGTGVARFLEQRGEGLHHLCFETDDVYQELATARTKGLALIDQQPRPGLAGMICFLHPRANHGVLIEYAQP
jgi:methylmalonyl-CoA epimerase